MDNVIEFMQTQGLPLLETIHHGDTGWFTLMFDQGVVVNVYPARPPIVGGPPGAFLNELRQKWRKHIEGNG